MPRDTRRNYAAWLHVASEVDMYVGTTSCRDQERNPVVRPRDSKFVRRPLRCGSQSDFKSLEMVKLKREDTCQKRIVTLTHVSDEPPVTVQTQNVSPRNYGGMAIYELS